MTGEMTLRGLVLPVGGIKDKVLAAHRYGIKRVILPERNLKDLVEVPSHVLSSLEILLARRMEDVIEQAFEDASGRAKEIAVGNASEGGEWRVSQTRLTNHTAPINHQQIQTVIFLLKATCSDEKALLSRTRNAKSARDSLETGLSTEASYLH